MRVLIVEDDPLLGDALAAGLKQRGFEPDWVRDGHEAQTVMRVEPFAAIILDLGLPGLTGLELLRTERARGNKVPVLILTARDAVQDRIKGLETVAPTTTWSNRRTSMSSRRGCERSSDGRRGSPRRSSTLGPWRSTRLRERSRAMVRRSICSPENSRCCRN